METSKRLLSMFVSFACVLALIPAPTVAWAEDEGEPIVEAEEVQTDQLDEGAGIGEADGEGASSDEDAVEPEEEAAGEQQQQIAEPVTDQAESDATVADESGSEAIVTEGVEPKADTEEQELNEGQESDAEEANDVLLTAQSEDDALLVTMADNTVTVTVPANSTIQPALNKARDLTSGQKLVVKLTSGSTYTIGETLHIYSNTTFDLNGATIKRWSKDNDLSLLNTTYDLDGNEYATGGYGKAQNIVVKGGTWDSNYSVEGKVLHFTHAQNITIQNTTLKNCRADHVVIFDGVKNGKVSKVTFSNDIPDAKHNKTTRYSNEAIHIDACTKPGTGATGAPFDKTPCTSITVDSCTFDGVCTAAGSHYHFSGDVQQGAITFTNNTIKKIESGCTVVTAANTKGWTVKNNKYTGTGTEYFARLNGSVSYTIANNTVSNVKGFAEDNGKATGLKSSGTFSGNTVTSIKGTAFKCADIASTHTLSGEKYTTVKKDVKTTSTDDTFLYFSGATVTVKGCTLTSPESGYATSTNYIGTIKFDNCKLTFQGNKVYNTPYAGIYFLNAKSGSSITGNTFGYCARVTSSKGTNSFTIVLDKCKGVTVTNNTLKACRQGGIYLNGSSGNTVKNNTIEAAQGFVDVREHNSSNNGLSNNGPVFSGATSMPVQSTAAYSISGGTLKSSDSSVVSVSGKTLTAKKAGTATITLTYNGRNYTKKVKVYTIHGKTYEMESSVNSNYVLDIQKASTKNGAQMIVYKRNGGKNQKYQFYLQGDNTYCIRSLKSQKWLNVNTKDKKYVMQWSWTGGNNTKWRLTVDAANRITFVNKAYNKCFDVQGGKTQNGSKMIIWTSNGGLNQKWVLK